MKLEVQEDVLKVRAGRTSNEPADADADGNADEDDAERSSLWIGIAHLLTPARINEVRACRARCTRTVLTEQAGARARARQDPFLHPELGWEAIACASLAQTRKATLRAMKLGKFHRECICI